MSRYFLDEVYYFITVPTVNHNPFFETEKLKYSLLNQIKTAAELHRIKKIDYGILKNHYHFMGYFKNGKVIPSFLRCINGKSSNDVKKYLGHSVRVWDEYHVYIASTEQIYERIRGYIIGNSLKHGEVADLEELLTHPFSTFESVVEQHGRKYSEELVNSVIEMDHEQFFKFLTS
ncbi:MAG: transposase [Candidatus Uhrbacteria bacterium]